MFLNTLLIPYVSKVSKPASKSANKQVSNNNKFIQYDHFLHGITI